MTLWLFESGQFIQGCYKITIHPLMQRKNTNKYGVGEPAASAAASLLGDDQSENENAAI